MVHGLYASELLATAIQNAFVAGKPEVLGNAVGFLALELISIVAARPTTDLLYGRLQFVPAHPHTAIIMVGDMHMKVAVIHAFIDMCHLRMDRQRQ